MPHGHRFRHTLHLLRTRRPPRRRWFETRIWLEFLQNQFRYRARRRFVLHVDIHGPAGATDLERRTTTINPLAIAPPPRPLRRRIRHCPPTRAGFEQSIALALLDHEACHVRDSGPMPTGVLGWLWNSLEDERIERRDPIARERYEFLGDVTYLRSSATSDLLSGCLLWRWQWDRDDRRFAPRPEQWQLWELKVRPRVEAAWRAATSDEVTEIARQILALLGLAEDSPVPRDVPASLCGCDAQTAAHTASSSQDQGDQGPAPDTNAVGDDDAAPTPPPDAVFVGAGQGHDAPEAIDEADPAALRSTIEGRARELARVLHPDVPRQRTRPHRSRGSLVLDRVLAGSSRPLDERQMLAPRRQCALHMLLDVSLSMAYPNAGTVPIEGAREMAMLLLRAAELAQQPISIWAFADDEQPIELQPLGLPTERAARRIAGVRCRGGTRLAAVFESAVTLLAAREELFRLLVVLHDGELEAADARAVSAVAATCARRGVLLLPLFVGRDDGAVARNRAVFGHVLACEHASELAGMVGAWIRAALGAPWSSTVAVSRLSARLAERFSYAVASWS